MSTVPAPPLSAPVSDAELAKLREALAGAQAGDWKAKVRLIDGLRDGAESILAEITAFRTSAARAAVPITVEEIEREIEVNLEINHSLIDGEIVRVIVGIPEAARAIAPRQAEAPPLASGHRFLHFGLGRLVLNYGHYDHKPAVFISTANEPGPLGEPLPEAKRHPQDALQPDETVLVFENETGARNLIAEIVKALPLPEHAPPAQPGERTGVGWLLEWRETDAPASRYWHPESGWVWAADKALRFARREDAETYRKSTRLQGTPTEHVFGLLLEGGPSDRDLVKGLTELSRKASEALAATDNAELSLIVMSNYGDLALNALPIAADEITALRAQIAALTAENTRYRDGIGLLIQELWAKGTDAEPDFEDMRARIVALDDVEHERDEARADNEACALHLKATADKLTAAEARARELVEVVRDYLFHYGRPRKEEWLGKEAFARFVALNERARALSNDAPAEAAPSNVGRDP